MNLSFLNLCSKWVIEQCRQLTTSATHLTQQLLMNVQWWFKKFCKGDESLEDEEHSGWPSEVDANKLRAIIKTDPLKIMQEVAEELNIDHSMVIWHLKQIGMVKKLNEWVSHVHELTANQKNCRFAVSMFFYSTWTIFRLDCDVWWIVDFILQPGMTRLVVCPRNSKALSKAKLAPKKGHGHCLVSAACFLSTTAFWILAKPLHLRSMFNKLMRCTEDCSQHCSTQRARFFSRTTPNDMAHNQHLKTEQIGLRRFALSTIFTWPLTSGNRLQLLQTSWQLFTGKMLPQPAGGRKCFPRVCLFLKHRFLHYRNKPTYFSLTKMCWL